MAENQLVEVPFKGGVIKAVQDDAGTVWVPVRHVCETLGIALPAQRTKLMDAEWANVTIIVTLDTTGRRWKMFCIDLKSFPKWLSEINTNKIANQKVRELLVAYQKEAAEAVRDYFEPKKAAALVEVPFDGGSLLATQDANGDVWVALKRACERLGLAVFSQSRKLKGKPWARTIMLMVPDSRGVPQEAEFLHLDSLPMWLAGIDTERVAESAKDLLVKYQKRAAKVLADHFIRAKQQEQQEMPSPITFALASIQQMAGAIIEVSKRQDAEEKARKELEKDVVRVQATVDQLSEAETERLLRLGKHPHYVTMKDFIGKERELVPMWARTGNAATEHKKLSDQLSFELRSRGIFFFQGVPREYRYRQSGDVKLHDVHHFPRKEIREFIKRECAKNPRPNGKFFRKDEII